MSCIQCDLYDNANILSLGRDEILAFSTYFQLINEVISEVEDDFFLFFSNDVRWEAG